MLERKLIRCACIGIICAGTLPFPIRAAESPIKADEEVILFPSLATRGDRDAEWNVIRDVPGEKWQISRDPSELDAVHAKSQ